MCTVFLPPGDNPIAVNKYIIIKVGKPEGKRPVERPGRTWGDIKMILKKWDGGVDRIDLAQERDKCRAVVNKGSIKRDEFLY